MAETPQPTASETEFAKTIATAVADGIAATQRKKVPIGQYDPRTPFHPNKRQAKRLMRPCFQNGVAMDPKRLTNREIELLNQIRTPGRYLQKLVEVVLSEDGADGAKLLINYKNRTTDQRMEMRAYVRNFEDMLRQIVEEQDQAANATGKK